MSFALIFDLAAACALAFFAVRGLIRGLSGEIVGLVGFLASLFCSWTCAQPAAEYVLQYLPDWDPSLVSLGCTVAIFFAVMLVFALIDKIVSFLVDAANLSLMDHALGILVGALKTGCIVLFIYGVLTVFPFIPRDWMKESYAMRGAAVVWPPAAQLLEAWGVLDLKALAHPGGIEEVATEAEGAIPMALSGDQGR